MAFSRLIAVITAVSALGPASILAQFTPNSTQPTAMAKARAVDLKFAPEKSAKVRLIADDSGPNTDARDVFLTKKYSELMAYTPQLHGSYLHFHLITAEGITPQRFRVTRIFDRDKRDVQEREMNRFLRMWLPDGNYQIDPQDDRVYPVSNLLEKLRDRLDLEMEFRGCSVTDGYFESDPTIASGGLMDLALIGRASDERQLAAIRTLAIRLMSADSAWSNAPWFISQVSVRPLTDQKTVAVVNDITGVNGRFFFSRGLEHFWNANYDAASSDFRNAGIESPRELEYFYWRALAELAAGKRERASERMRYIVQGFNVEPLSYNYRVIFHSFKRVQGPLRQEFRQVEAQALALKSR